MISSLQGPCFYPAGHLWFYLPAYWLHIYTENAEYIVKFCFFIIHSMSIIIISRISYRYFKGSPEKAQLITFILLANEPDRVFNQLQFNDQVLGMFIYLVIYFVQMDAPYKAIIAFTTGLSIKAGALIIMPAFLGIIHYRYGLKMLFHCILIIYYT